MLVWIPGQILLRLSGVGEGWTAGPRAMLGLALATATMPVVLNPLWHLTNHGPTLILATAAGLAVAQEFSFALRTSGREALRLFQSPLEWLLLAALLGLVVFATIGTYWPGTVGAGPVPSQIHDYIKHHAVLFSLERRPLPLGNPFYAPRADGPVFYYHFFYLLPATLRAVAPSVSIPLAFGLQSALVAVTSVSLFALLARVLFGGGPPALLAAMLATVIGGLDIVPVVLLRLRAITLDAWADTLVRIHNLITQFVWTPQNMQGVLVLLLASFLLITCRRTGTLALLLGLLTASLIGSTVWVAAAVLPAAVLLLMVALRGGRNRPPWVLVGLGGATAVIFALPSMLGYLRTAGTLGKSLTLGWPHQERALLGQFLPAGLLANLADLPWVLLLEFGPLLVLPMLLPRAAWAVMLRSPGGRLLLGAGTVGLLAFVTVRSHFTYNDFGQKVILATQAAGVILAAGILHGRPGRAAWWNPLGWQLRRGVRFGRGAAVLAIALCVAGLPVGLLQTPVATVRRLLPPDGRLGPLVPDEAVRARRQADLLRTARDLPRDAVVQGHWTTARLDLLQMIDHQVGVTEIERDTMVFQAGPPEARQADLAALAGVLETAAPVAGLHAVLVRLGVTHVLVGEVERAAWQDLARLSDAAWFEVVAGGPDWGIYRVRRSAAGTGSASGQ